MLNLKQSMHTMQAKNPALFKSIGLILLLLLPFLVGSIGGNSWVRNIDSTLLYVMLALGLNIVVGFAGLLDLGYIAFFAVGAYTTALLSSPHLSNQFETMAAWFPEGLHAGIWLCIILSAILAAFFGALLGSPTLKLKGDYLAIVTLGFGEIIRIFMNNLDRPYNLTNGAKGIISIDGVKFFGIDLSQEHAIFGVTLNSAYFYYYVFLAFVLLIVFASYRIQNSRMGRAFVAIRENEIAAKAMGINTRNIKLAAFAFGASFGGISGALFASFQQFVSPESFSLTESILVLAMVVIGGIGHIPGVILGAVVIYNVPELLRSHIGPLQETLFNHVFIDPEVARQLLFALALLFVMLLKSDGLWPAPKHEDKK